MATAALTPFAGFITNLPAGLFDLNGHTLKVMLSNVAPVAANALKADLTEIAAEHGYSAGGSAVGSPAYAVSGGVGKLTGTNVVFTASGGSFGPFRYAVLYDDTAAGKPLIGWADYGSAITPAASDTVTVAWDGTAGILTVEVGA